MEKHFGLSIGIAKELGEDAKPEQVLKVMEAVGGLALKFALDKKEGPFGFNKQSNDGTEETNTESDVGPELILSKRTFQKMLSGLMMLFTSKKTRFGLYKYSQRTTWSTLSYGWYI